jgi:hypothetical protein
MGNFPTAEALGSQTVRARDFIIRDGQNKMQQFAKIKMLERTSRGYFDVSIKYADLCKYCKEQSAEKDLCYLKPDGSLQDEMLEWLIDQLKQLGYVVHSTKECIDVNWKPIAPTPTPVPSVASSGTTTPLSSSLINPIHD